MPIFVKSRILAIFLGMAELRHTIFADWRSSLIYFLYSISYNFPKIYTKHIYYVNRKSREVVNAKL